jgi:dihydropteroate synthase
MTFSSQSLPLTAWALQNRVFLWGKQTYLMGVLNITPDSFSDGGDYNTLDAAIARAQTLIAAGADILDIGGQSTRPQAQEVALEEEWQRVIPVVQAIRQTSTIPISVDTTRSAIAVAAVAAGADVINDISGATYDPDMLPTVAHLGVPIILMHIRGTPATMQQLTQYSDLIGELRAWLKQRVEAAIAAGVDPGKIAIDPGIGFAKTYTQNLEILRHVSAFRSLGYPVLIGASRKSFLGHILNRPDPKQRVWGTAAACCAAIAGGADILRIHDVQEMRDVCQVADAIWRPAKALQP